MLIHVVYFLGDNSNRLDGDSNDFLNIQQFAWEVTEHAPESQRGVVHVHSNPTKTEYIYKHSKELQKKRKASHKKELGMYYTLRKILSTFRAGRGKNLKIYHYPKHKLIKLKIYKNCNQSEM